METISHDKPTLDTAKFRDPERTATGAERATVSLNQLDTLWINTGTLCNLACANCYIESSPRNDALVYITAAEVAAYLDEIERDGWGTQTIGFTGGEPFMNREFMTMLDDALGRGFEVLVLTNAMKPMTHHRQALLNLRAQYGQRLHVRVSIDHYTRDWHEAERGPASWTPMINGLAWLSQHGFNLSLAGRLFTTETETEMRAGFARLFSEERLNLDANSPDDLTLFPEMNADTDVAEITSNCWEILDQSPDDIMCASSRMVVKRKGADSPAVLSCTLLPYDSAFELGRTLAEADQAISLNHPHCAQFCVLGGASCSG